MTRGDIPVDGDLPEQKLGAVIPVVSPRKLRSTVEPAPFGSA